MDKYLGIRFLTDRIQENMKIRVHPEIPPHSDLIKRAFHTMQTRNKRKDVLDDTVIPAILNTAMCFKAMGWEQPFYIMDVALKLNTKGVKVMCIPHKVRLYPCACNVGETFPVFPVRM